LVLDEYGFGDHGTAAAWTGEPGDCRQQMQKEDRQIAHRSILSKIAIRATNTHHFVEFAIHKYEPTFAVCQFRVGLQLVEYAAFRRFAIPY
jgi:hypothetical protein